MYVEMVFNLRPRATRKGGGHDHLETDDFSVPLKGLCRPLHAIQRTQSS